VLSLPPLCLIEEGGKKKRKYGDWFGQRRSRIFVSIFFFVCARGSLVLRVSRAAAEERQERNADGGIRAVGL
jgi:hypothetical protein